MVANSNPDIGLRKKTKLANVIEAGSFDIYYNFVSKNQVSGYVHNNKNKKLLLEKFLRLKKNISAICILILHIILTIK